MKIARCVLFPLWSLVMLAGLSAAPPSVSIPSGGRELIAADATERAQAILPKDTAIAHASKITAEGAPWTSYWRFEIAKMPPNSWSVELQTRVPAAIKQGDKCLLLLYARSTGPEKAVGAANVEISSPPYAKVGRSEFRVGPAWEPVLVPFAASGDVPEGKGAVTIQVGAGIQTIELGGLRLLDYGADFPFEKLPHPLLSYEGREEGAAWRKEALARIEKIRKGGLTVQVVDKNGAPVSGAEVHLVLKRHHFGFGSAVTAKWLTDTSPDGEKYRAIVDECFSRVVLENDLKRGPWEDYKKPNQTGSYRKEWLDAAMAWCGAHHIPVRGHYLCWAPWEPWSEKLKDKPDELRTQILDHLREEVSAVGNRVCEWDALNHPAAWEKGICIDTVLGKDFYAGVFKEARKVTKLPLWINEDQVFRPGRQQDEYYEIIQQIIAAGAKPDGIGNQAHFHSSFLPSPDDMLKNSDRFAKLVPALQLTEFDINTNGDDALAADFTRDILITAFSHPAYTGFVMWGFWEGSHWIPAAALWRKDWSEKHTAKVWREWVCGKWKTDEKLTTDAKGDVSCRGFFGRYEVTVSKGNRTVSAEQEFTPQGAGNFKVVLP
jgi:GH35 family endo-1,4-beta-xylanase